MTEPVWSAPLDSDVPGAGYTNSAAIATTQWDLTIDFQFTTPAPGRTGEAAPFALQRVTRVVMSLAHAKVLGELVSNAVKGWESQFGSLPDVSTLLNPRPADSEGKGASDE